jgi:hypothetical protein
VGLSSEPWEPGQAGVLEKAKSMAGAHPQEIALKYSLCANTHCLYLVGVEDTTTRKINEVGNR